MSEVIPAINQQQCSIDIYGETSSKANRSEIRFYDNTGAFFFKIEFCNLKYNDASIIIAVYGLYNNTWERKVVASKTLTGKDKLPINLPYKFTIDFSFHSGKARIITQAGRQLDMKFFAPSSIEGMTTAIVRTDGQGSSVATLAWSKIYWDYLYIDENNIVWGCKS